MDDHTEIAGFAGYSVDRLGNVYSYRMPGAACGNRRLEPKVLKPWHNNVGYCVVSLMKDGKILRKTVHRLIALAFLPADPDRPHVNHKNGIKDDNRVENLEWSNKKENAEHAFRVLKRFRRRGEERYFAKLTEKSVKKIRVSYAAGRTMRELAEKYGVSVSTIRETVHRRAWVHVP